MKTAIVILNWNGEKLLQEFLPGIIEHAANDAEVIIADNASTDNSLEWINKNFPGTRIIINPTNEGFAKGYNTALKQVDAEYFLLLNSDVAVTANFLRPLIIYLDENPGTAVCQPKIRWQKNKESFEYAGASGGFIDELGYPFCRGRIFGDMETDTLQYENNIPVFWTSGACMLIRSSVFKSMGGFDELFFAHMEEIDLCWRIRNAGHEIVCVPSSTVYHVGGATLPKNNPGKTFLNFRNNLSMLYKNLPGENLFFVILTRTILDLIAGFKFLFESGSGDFLAVIRAHYMFYSWIISGKLKRDNNTKIKNHATIYPGYIVWDYYIADKKKFTDLKFNPEKKLKR